MQNVAIVVLGVDINAFQFAHCLRKDEGILPIDSATDLKKNESKIKYSNLPNKRVGPFNRVGRIFSLLCR